MKNWSYVLTIALWGMFSSCATLMNGPRTTVSIQTSRPSKLIFQRDTLSTSQRQIKLDVPRSPSPLQVFVIDTSARTELLLPSRNSSAYYLNLLYNGGIGMWWERDRLERYTYPKNVYLDLEGEEIRWLRFSPKGRKGEKVLQLSIPYINHFYLQPQAEIDIKSNTGFLGIGLGLDYYFHDQQFLQLSLNAAMDFLVPFPAPIHYDGEYEIMTSVYTHLSHQFHLKRWKFGYGLSVARNTWRLNHGRNLDNIPLLRDPVTKSRTMLGAVVPIYYQVSSNFHLGMQYRPGFLSLEGQREWLYEHLFSIDLAWKWRL